MTPEIMKDLLSKAETLDLTDDERKKASGCFVDLPCGNTHYELSGTGENVVLVHGYATPYFIYDKVFRALVAAGYRVLRYDLLGRGLSERVKTDYTPELFARQLDEITKKFFGDEKFILAGTSMGGSITTAFCALHSERVSKLLLLAPAGMDTFKPPFYMELCKIPVFGKKLFMTIGAKSLLNGCASEMKYSLDEKDYFMTCFAYAQRYKGFLECTFSSLLNTILRTNKTAKNYFAVEKNRIPTLVIWGTEDRTMPIYQLDRMKQILNTCTEFKIYENSGHIFVYDEGERTVKDILNFIRA